MLPLFYLFLGLLFLVPIFLIAWLVISLVCMYKEKKKEVGNPSVYLTQAIISGVLLALYIIALAVLLVVFALAIAHM